MAETKKLVTPVFRISFPNVFEPDSYDGGPAKYGCSAIWNPSKFSEMDKKRWKAIKAAMNDEAKSRFKKSIKELPSNYKIGLRNGNEKELEGYGEGTMFANLSTKMRPGVIDLKKNKISPEEGNQEEIYPGCYCRATVNIYSYDNKGKGIAIGLMNLQKIADGPRLDSRTNADQDFEDEDIDANWLEQDENDIDEDEF